MLSYMIILLSALGHTENIITQLALATSCAAPYFMVLNTEKGVP